MCRQGQGGRCQSGSSALLWAAVGCCCGHRDTKLLLNPVRDAKPCGPLPQHCHCSSCFQYLQWGLGVWQRWPVTGAVVYRLKSCSTVSARPRVSCSTVRTKTTRLKVDRGRKQPGTETSSEAVGTKMQRGCAGSGDAPVRQFRGPGQGHSVCQWMVTPRHAQRPHKHTKLQKQKL